APAARAAPAAPASAPAPADRTGRARTTGSTPRLVPPRRRHGHTLPACPRPRGTRASPRTRRAPSSAPGRRSAAPAPGRGHRPTPGSHRADQRATANPPCCRHCTHGRSTPCPGVAADPASSQAQRHVRSALGPLLGDCSVLLIEAVLLHLVDQGDARDAEATGGLGLVAARPVEG